MVLFMGLNNSHYIYAGLQVSTLVLYLFDVGTSNANLHITSSHNGSVLVFDMHQTASGLRFSTFI